MRAKPIYVELPIRIDMETLWTYTQTPELHREWDLRFSDIAYLPRRDDERRQRFRYRTRIGFGLSVSGTGETRSYSARPEGERLSTLRFGSEQAISLIRQGGGYWRYRPEGDRIAFITRYDYRTRFGAAGRLFDRLLFRPLFGYATAWSFDALRLWLERRIPPASSVRLALVHYASVSSLALLWLWQGLVPKLLHPGTGELELLARSGLLRGAEHGLVVASGVAELALAACLLLGHRHRLVYRIQSLALALLTAAALFIDPGLAAVPFGPLPLVFAMLALAFFSASTIRDLPDARRCLRRPGRKEEPVPTDIPKGASPP